MTLFSKRLADAAYPKTMESLGRLEAERAAR